MASGQWFCWSLITDHFLFLPRHCYRRANQIHQRERQQKFPAKRHQLVVAEARQRPAHPYIQKEKRKNLRREPEHREQRLQNRRPKDRPMPSAEKQKCRQARHRDHVRVLGHKEHGKLHRAVFGVIPRDQFSFGFGQIEWDSVRLRVRRHQIAEETNRLNENIPARKEMPKNAALRVYDVAQTEAPRKNQHAHQRQSQRNLVAHHLRAGAQAAEQRIFIVR